MHKLSIEEYQGKMIMRVEKGAMCVYNHNDSVSAGDNIDNNIVCMIMKVNKKNHR